MTTTTTTAPLARILRRTANPQAIRRWTANGSHSNFGSNGQMTARFHRPPILPYPTRTMVTVTQTKVSIVDSSSAEEAVAAPPKVTITQSSASAENPPPSEEERIGPNEIAVTASCAARIRELASAKRPDDPSSVYLRVYVDAGGCSGFQYKFDLESEGSQEEDDDEGIDEEDDVVFEKDGSRVVIDRASLELIGGSRVDFVREMIRSSFAVVDNPQSESACGCGSSFAVKNFEANPAID